MKKNMHIVDSSLRILAAIAIAVLIFTSTLTGIAAIILGIFAVVFLITGLFSYCPLYSMAGFSTSKKDTKTV
jgi:hypothetical protein